MQAVSTMYAVKTKLQEALCSTKCKKPKGVCTGKQSETNKGAYTHCGAVKSLIYLCTLHRVSNTFSLPQSSHTDECSDNKLLETTR